MQQVFLNFMVTALHSMTDGGTLDIEVKVNEPGGEVVITFSDTGDGLSRNDLRAAYEEGISPESPSIGLGLGISRRLAENNRGRIEVTNRSEAKGTVYTVRLPLKGKHV